MFIISHRFVKKKLSLLFNLNTIFKFIHFYILFIWIGMIQVIACPPLSLGQDVILCQGDSVQLDVSLANASFIWQDSSTAPTFWVTEPGVYWVERTSVGCVKYDTISVSFFPTDFITGYSSGCIGDSIKLNAGFSGASFEWFDGSTGNSVTVDQSGNYWVLASYNNCLELDSFEVTFDSCEACNRGLYELAGNANDSSGYAMHAVLLPTLDGPTADTGYDGMFGNALYFDGYQDAMELPVAFDFPERTISILFKADSISSQIRYLFYSDHTSLNFGGTIIAVQEIAGVKKLIFANGSGNVHQESINEHEWYLATLTVGALEANYYLNCAHLASFPSSYNSSSNLTSNVYVGNVDTSTSGFQGTIDFVQIDSCEWNSNEVCRVIECANLDLGPDTVICENDTLKLNVFAPNTRYLWQDSSELGTFSVIDTGWYSVETNSIGCMNLDSIYIEKESCSCPDKIIEGDSVGCLGDTLFLEVQDFPNALYQWSTGSNESGIYVFENAQIQLRAEFDTCLVNQLIQVRFEDCEVKLEMPNIFSPNDVDNMNSVFKPILVNGIQEAHTRIYNRFGKLIFETQDVFINWIPRGEPDGVYYYSINYTGIDDSSRVLKGWVRLAR